MLRLLSIRNFAVVEALEVEFRPGFTVLTGETGAGKSILLDALSLLLGDRFETRQLRPAPTAPRSPPSSTATRRRNCARGLRSRTWATTDRCCCAACSTRRGEAARTSTAVRRRWRSSRDIGERLIDLHGQHAHQSLGRPEAQRQLLDAFGGFEALAREVAAAWRAWREAIERRDRGGREAAARQAERDTLAARDAELSALGATSDEWQALSQAQSRLAHAATLLEAATAAEPELTDGDAAIGARLAAVAHRLKQAAQHDQALSDIVAARRRGQDSHRRGGPQRYARIANASTSIRASSRASRRRLAAIHDVARKHRVRPEELPALADETARRLAELVADSDVDALERAADQARQSSMRCRASSRPSASSRRCRSDSKSPR